MKGREMKDNFQYSKKKKMEMEAKNKVARIN